MSETLYRKYRPKNFSEIIGQTHIVRTLSGAVKNGRVGSAYLFTGPRGTGKTSLARILAKTVNCEKLKGTTPCEKCSSCQIINSGRSLDIIEIDAASNTGVDNIRELRETVAVATSDLRFKVYIIDEVHMLSTGAFNALLKTLEEPPKHVIFILATTEIHKVPDTIISRCQRFDFTRLPLPDIQKKLSLIAEAEKVKIEKEALEMIAVSAEGGMRDAESLLGQVISLEDKNITVKEAREILGVSDSAAVEETIKALLEKDSAAAIAKINELARDGYDLLIFTKSLVNHLRQLMLMKISSSLEKYFSFELTQEKTKRLAELTQTAELSFLIKTINLFLEAQGKISASPLPQLPLEIAVVKATQTFPAPAHIDYKIENKKNLSPALGEMSRSNREGKGYIEPVSTSPISTDTNIDLSVIRQNWKKLLIDIRPYNHSLSALLSNCQPQKVVSNLLTLATPYDFYQERLSDHNNKLTVEKVFSKILGVNIRLEIVIDKTLTLKKEAAEAAAEQKPSEQNSLLSDAMEIMGGKVVEE